MTEIKNIIVKNKKIFCQFFGSDINNSRKPILIFLHEGLGSVAQWKDFPEALSNELNLPAFAYDRYGYGKSDGLDENRKHDYLEEEALEYLPEVFDLCGIANREKILIGHSDGGSIALVYASAFPDTIKAVITEAAHVFTEDITLNGVKPVKELFVNGGLKQKLEKYHGEKTESMFFGWYNVWSNEKFKEWNIEHYLKNISCPVLAMQGKDDEYGTEKQLDAICKEIGKHCKIMLIDNCGHTPHHQAREKTQKKMINFIKNLSIK